jgi:hypothetical protein
MGIVKKALQREIGRGHKIDGIGPIGLHTKGQINSRLQTYFFVFFKDTGTFAKTAEATIHGTGAHIYPNLAMDLGQTVSSFKSKPPGQIEQPEIFLRGWPDLIKKSCKLTF